MAKLQPSRIWTAVLSSTVYVLQKLELLFEVVFAAELYIKTPWSGGPPSPDA